MPAPNSVSAALQCIEGSQAPLRTCPLCKVAFEPKKPWQAFCCAEHRTAYDQEFGTLGKVATVRKIKTGVSVSIHLSGPAAERALNLALGELVRLVRQPT